ncbi:hypothetical protein [Aquirufa rosea]|uniref:Uncharacterized protein n=1 Tax=Aquirufa rosea TaxID=2509241 RepID=A0A4V1M5P4_9BACT|nr:hypothetical protein [Aquirufa rosea]RXK52122.1 hypothetical protein ESB04_00250 [Aquirufa rosea]
MRFIQKWVFNFRAQTSHGLHSPSVYKLYTEVINPILNQRLPTQNSIEELILGISQFYAKVIDENKVIPLVIPTLSPEVYQQIDEILIPQAKSNSILFIINPYKNTLSQDIWDTLIDDPRVIHSVDLFELGFFRFNKMAQKEHFILKKM